MTDPKSTASGGRSALLILFMTQAIAAVGLAAGGTAGGLLAEQIAGTAAVGALPLGLLVVGAGVSAPLVTALMKRKGRRAGLIVALVVALAGTLVVLLGAAAASLTLVLAGSVLFGAGNTSVMLARYMAADLSPPERLGRSVSTMMFAVTLGAVGGPSLLGPSAGMARALDLPDGAGLYLVSVVALSVAAAFLFALPPSTPSRQDGAHEPADDLAGVTGLGKIIRETAQIPRIPLAILASANFTMVAVMSIAPVHLHVHGWSTESIGMVISLHIGLMYAPSPLFGWARDRVGSLAVAAMGAAMLAAAGILGMLSGMTGFWVSIILLGLLGVGWNAQLVSGSALLVEMVPARLRYQAEGIGELGMGMAAALGALVAAGPLIAVGGMELLSATAVLLNVLMTGMFLVLHGQGYARSRGSWGHARPDAQGAVGNAAVELEVQPEPGNT